MNKVKDMDGEFGIIWENIFKSDFPKMILSKINSIVSKEMNKSRHGKLNTINMVEPNPKKTVKKLTKMVTRIVKM